MRRHRVESPKVRITVWPWRYRVVRTVKIRDGEAMAWIWGLWWPAEKGLGGWVVRNGPPPLMNRIRPSRVHDRLAELAWGEVSGPVPLEALRGERKTAPLCRERWRVWRAMKARGVPVAAIGRFFRRDHSTVLAGLRRSE